MKNNMYGIACQNHSVKSYLLTFHYFL